MAKLRMAGIVKESIVDGKGIRFVVFVQGCPHHCAERGTAPLIRLIGT